VIGCGSNSTTVDRDAGQMVYVDTTTDEAVVADVSSEYPVLNPQTGKKTLKPGLYCWECKKWYPVPPLDQINRIPNGAICPKTGRPLSSEGPWPDEME